MRPFFMGLFMRYVYLAAVLGVCLLFNLVYFDFGGEGLKAIRNNIFAVPIFLALFVALLFGLGRTSRVAKGWLILCGLAALVTTLAVLLGGWNTFRAYYPLFVAWLLLVAAVIEVDRRTLLWIAFSAIFFQLVYGFAQVFYLFGQPWYPLSAARPLGGVLQVNVFASTLATGVVLAAYLFMTTQRLAAQVWLGLFNLTVFVALYMAASKAGYLGLGLAALLFAGYVTTVKPRWHLASKWLLASWAVGLLLAVVFGLLKDYFQLFQLNALSQRSLESMAAVGSRVDLYQSTLGLIAQSPWIGHGFRDFLDLSFPYFATTPLADGRYMPLRLLFTGHPHNELLMWAADGGVVYLVSYLAAILLFWGLALKHLGGKAWLGTIALVPLAVHTMVELPFYHSALSTFLLVAVLYGFFEFGKPVRINLPSKLGLATLSLLCLTFLVANTYSLINLNRYLNGFDQYREGVVVPFLVADTLAFIDARDALVTGLQSGQADLTDEYQAMNKAMQGYPGANRGPGVYELCMERPQQCGFADEYRQLYRIAE